ncbi:MAG: hypothetical protein JSC161_000564 [Candidatus Tokpelaia sp. JSC161]|nr:MAG: hypothetical protein JSC161_000564 [Candidatus Tokpelaia sp. JSC161]
MISIILIEIIIGISVPSSLRDIWIFMGYSMDAL